jgi:diguanylate cyclase (GGDEF)-like protein
MVASRIGKVTGGGRPFRYGGEEFSILFPGATVEGALPHIEGVRERVEATPFVLRHPSRSKKKRPAAKVGTAKLSITVSIGVSERVGGSDSETVIKNADQALYKAKQEGRNRVCVQGGRKS